MAPHACCKIAEGYAINLHSSAKFAIVLCGASLPFEVMSFFPDLVSLAVVVASILGVGMLIPQAVNMALRREFNGVSPSWIGGGVAINGGWIAYAVTADLPGLLPVSLGAALLYCWMAVMSRKQPFAVVMWIVVSALVLAALFVAAAILAGVAGVGTVVASLYAGQFAPAAWSALTSRNVSGVSVLTWVMAVAEAAIWAVYGLAQDDRNLVIGGAGAVVMSTVVIISVLRSARARPTLTASPRGDRAIRPATIGR